MLTASEIKFYTSLNQKKSRKESGKFLIEGAHLIEECLNSKYKIDLIIFRDDIEHYDYKIISDKIKEKKTRTESISFKSFKKISETESSQGIVGVVSMNETKLNPDYGSPVIVLDSISDPGNLGTIIRTAYWFGAGAVLISENSADIYNSKALRATQGAIFHFRIENNINMDSKLKMLRESGYKIFLLTPKGDLSLNVINKNEKSVFVFGNESEGISEHILNKGYDTLKIDGYSDCESLNVGVAAGIVLFSFCEGAKKQKQYPK